MTPAAEKPSSLPLTRPTEQLKQLPMTEIIQSEAENLKCMMQEWLRIIQVCGDGDTLGEYCPVQVGAEMTTLVSSDTSIIQPPPMA